LRIGFFTDTYTPQINGVVTSISLFTSELERQGHAVYVFAPTPRQPKDGAHVVRLPSVPFVFQPEMRLAAAYDARAHTQVKRANLDIIHSHDPFAVGVFGLAMAKRFRLPYVHTYHTLYPEYVHYIWDTWLTRELAERMSRDFSNQCDTVIAPSTKIREALLEWGTRKPIVTLPTGVNVSKYGERDEAGMAAFRARFDVRPDERLLIFVGRLGLEKNIDALVDAMHFVRTPGARLLIVGDGPYRADLEKHARKDHVADKVVFTGYLRREDVTNAYHASDVFFFASVSETQGLVVGEALASGLPVVAVNDLAIADAVTDGSNGFLVPQDPQALASAADRLLEDPELWQRMSAAASERAQELSIANQTQRLLGVYEQLIESRPPRRRVGTILPTRRIRVVRQLRALSSRGDQLVRQVRARFRD
jgi:1,2-diacylglycerol 3-alpha-glucosyltransferase